MRLGLILGFVLLGTPALAQDAPPPDAPAEDGKKKKKKKKGKDKKAQEPAAAAAAEPERLPIRVDGQDLYTVSVARVIARDDQTYDITVAPDSFRLMALEELRAVGHNALGAENVLFGQDDSSKARFLIGGTVKDFRCVMQSSFTACAAMVQWELFDQRSDKVVYQVTTKGGYQDDSYRVTEDHVFQSLRGSLRSMLSRDAFVELLQRDSSPRAATGATIQWHTPLAVRNCSASPAQLPDATSKVLAATLLVRQGATLGNAVLISPDGFALTAAHLVQGASVVTVQAHDSEPERATVLRVDTASDLAIIKLEGKGHPCRPLAGEPPALASPVYAVGAQGSAELAFSVTRGIVSGYRQWESHLYLQTDATLNAGSSGGPIVDELGRVVAITSWNIQGKGFEGLGFGVPVSAATDRLAVAWGTRSTSNPTTEAPSVASTGADGVYVDVADGAIVLPSLASAKKKVEYGRYLTVGGSIASTAGGLVLLVSMLTQPQTFQGERQRNQAITAGLILAGAGAVMAFTGRLITSNGQMGVGAAPMPGGGALVLGGSFR